VRARKNGRELSGATSHGAAPPAPVLAEQSPGASARHRSGGGGLVAAGARTMMPVIGERLLLEDSIHTVPFVCESVLSATN
jgi:hypothetical protein